MVLENVYVDADSIIMLIDAEVQGNSATSTIDICGDGKNGIGVTQPDKVLYKHSTKKT